jgi:hypothetical protein
VLLGLGQTEARDFIEQVPTCQTSLRIQARCQKKAQLGELRLNPPKEEGGGDWVITPIGTHYRGDFVHRKKYLLRCDSDLSDW